MSEASPVPEALRLKYERRLGLYQQLLDEAKFSLESAIGEAGIKMHSLTGRIKSWASVINKAATRTYNNPLEEMTDIVGIRAVCLFIDDLPRLRSATDSVFKVVKEEDKIEGGPIENFGYMSAHYDCNIRPNHVGPRYDPLRGLTFEVQCRTILMDAWANVSHHLAYKGETSIPEHLRRDFHALSGLFYVADRHFALFFSERQESQRAAAAAVTVSPSEDVPLNLDTLTAFLRQRYPERHPADDAATSDLVEELQRFGYTSLLDLETALKRGDRAALAYEQDNPPITGGQYADIGIVRQAVAITNAGYAAAKYEFGDTHQNYAHLIDEG